MNPQQQEIIQLIASEVKQSLEGEGSGHDWWHVVRVWNMAKHLGKSEGTNMFVVELAALLHDIADWKFNGGDDTVGPKMARGVLEKHSVAVGVARTFAYGGNKNRTMYDPNKKPLVHQSKEDYFKNESTTINHFYERLLLLKDRMNTATAKEIASGRHRFMEEYLDRFYKEWDGKV